MSVTENIDRIEQGKTSIISSIKSKGVNVPNDVLINEIAPYINEIQSGGGGGDTPSQPDIPELVQKYEGASVFRIETLKDECEIGFAPFRKNTSYKDFSYMIDWGDGSAIEEIDTDSHIYHIYNTKGVYDINCYNFNKTQYISTTKEIQTTKGYQYLNAFDNPKNDSYSFSYTNNKEYDYKCTNILVGNNLDIYNLSNNPYLETIYIRYIPTSSNLSSVYNKYSNNTNLRIVKSDFDLTIGRSYFSDCISLESIITPNGVVLTNDSSFFSGCKQLKNISLKFTSSYKRIGTSAFKDCSSLTSITIPNGYTSIGDSAFSYCSSLQSVVIPEGVTSIDSSAFSHCSSLQSVVIPEGVTSIGSNTFYNCSSLQSVVISESVTSIGQGAFRDCSSLQSVVIPEGVTSIGNTTFSGCYSLQSIELPEGVTTIGQGAFNNCTSLQTITVNAMTAPTIQSNTFPTSSFKYTKRYLYVPKDSVGYDEGNWKTYLIDKGWELRYIEEYVKTPTTMKLKTKNNFLHKWDYIGGAKLVDYDLIDNEYIYHFDDKIEQIIEYTFYNEVLKEIELPEGVTSIGSYAFSYCSSLQSIVIPEGVTSIGNYAFNNCTSLQSVVIPEGVTSIGNYAFQYCYSLQSVVIPESVTSIDYYTFQYCSSLQSVVIPEGVTSIGDSAFSYCSSLQSVVIPEGVTSIDSSAFSNCSSLQTITVNAMTAPTIQYDTFQSVGTKVPSGTPKILRVPKGATGYDEGNWKSYLINKGYTLEYIE